MQSKRLVVMALLGLLVSGCLYTVEPADQEQATGEDARVTPVAERKYQDVVVGGNKLYVEVADTMGKYQLGLSYRKEIGSDGMLFVMGGEMVPTFWMKGMLMPLDFVWVGSREGKLEVVDVTENVPAPEDPENQSQFGNYRPSGPVSFVLEVPAGWVKLNGVERGDEVEIPKK